MVGQGSRPSSLAGERRGWAQPGDIGSCNRQKWPNCKEPRPPALTHCPWPPSLLAAMAVEPGAGKGSRGLLTFSPLEGQQQQLLPEQRW